MAAPFKFHWNSYQVYDNVFLTKGIHSMKFGANVERLQGNTFGADFPGGQVIFNGGGSECPAPMAALITPDCQTS